MTAVLTVRAASQAHGHPELGQIAVNPAKTLPATTTGGLFVVTGTISCSLVGLISTALGAVADSPTLGVTGSPAIIAAAPSVAYNANAAGGVICMPTALGGPLPAPVTAQSVLQSVDAMEISNTTITITTTASTTGAITWILIWAKLFPKHNASVTNV